MPVCGDYEGLLNLGNQLDKETGHQWHQMLDLGYRDEQRQLRPCPPSGRLIPAVHLAPVGAVAPMTAWKPPGQ